MLRLGLARLSPRKRLSLVVFASSVVVVFIFVVVRTTDDPQQESIDERIRKAVLALRAEPYTYHRDNRGRDIVPAARGELQKFGPVVLPAMWALLEDPDPSIRYWALSVISGVSWTCGDHSSLPVLLRGIRKETDDELIGLYIVILPIMPGMEVPSTLMEYVDHPTLSWAVVNCMNKLFDNILGKMPPPPGSQDPRAQELEGMKENLKVWWRDNKSRITWSDDKLRFVVR